MLKVFLGFLITIQTLILLLMIYCFSGISILLPGLGLVVAGELVSVLLLIIEIILFIVTLILFRRLRRDSGRLA